MPRALRRVVLVACALATLAGAAPATALDGLPGTAPESLVGTYELLAKDVLDSHGDLTHVYQDVLRVPGKAIPIRLPAGHGLTGGTKIRVSARRYDASTFTVSSFQRLAPASVLGTSGTSSVLVILAYWTAPDSMSRTRASAQIFGDDDKWFREVSYGNAGLAGVVTPWVKIAPPAGGQCYTDAERIRTNAVTKAAALGTTYNAANYQKTILYFPKCTGSDTKNVAGWAYEPGSTVWLNGVMDRRTSVHELGHSFGMGHARSYVCESPSGMRVSLSRSCTAPEYGDPYDAMGTSPYAAHFTGYRKDRAGWLGKRKRVMTTSSSTFTLPPFEKPSSLPVVVVANSPTAANRRYWLEYRRPVGMDARLPPGATGGVMVHIEDSVPRGWLLDPTPRDASMTTAVIKPGTTWTAPDYVRIKVSSIGSTGARVTVTGAKPAPVPPSAPRSVIAETADRSALLVWLAPSSTGGAPIVAYDITATAPGQATRTATTPNTWATLPLNNDVTYTIAVRARNVAGTGPAGTVTARAVEPKPGLRLTSPAPGAVLTGEVTLTAVATPNAETNSDIVCVVFTVDGLDRAAACNPSPTYPTTYTARLPSSHFPNGAHTVGVRTYDNDGHAATDGPFPVTMSNPFPVVEITAPAGGSVHDAEVVTFEARAALPAGAEGSVTEVRYYDVTHGWDRYIGTTSVAPFRLAWQVTEVAGQRKVVAVARGSNGLQGRSAPVTVTVVHPPATVTFTPPDTASGTSLHLTAEATAVASGAAIAHVEFTVNGVPFGKDTTAPYEADWDIAAVSGIRYLGVRAAETSGRVTVTPNLRIAVTNVLPAVAITAPAAGAKTGPGTVTLAGTTGGTTGGEAPERVLVSVDGVQVADVPAADGWWSFPWDNAARYGAHTVTATAVTAAGLRSLPATRGFTVERPVPAVTMVSPAAAQVVRYGSAMAVAVEAVPGAGDPATIQRVCVGYENYGYYYGDYSCTTTTVSPGRYETSWSPWLSTGSYRLMVAVVMSDGHRHVVPGNWITVALPPVAPTLDLRSGDGTIVATVGPGTPWSPAPQTYVVRLGDETRTVTAGEVTFGGLTNGVTYEVSAHAVNALGTGPTTTRSARPGVPTSFALGSFPGERHPYGTVVPITAHLRDKAGTGLAGQPVTLASCGLYRSTCTPLGNATTGANGTVTMTFTVTEYAFVRFEFAGTDHYLPSTGPGNGALVNATPVVSATLEAATVRAGEPAHLIAAVLPAQSSYVAAMVYQHGEWFTETLTWTDYNGNVTVPLWLAAGKYPVKMMVHSNSNGTWVSSQTLTLTVTS